MLYVERLVARAHLDPSPAVLADAEKEAACGDESWGEWVAEYRRGDALLLRVDVTVELSGGEVEPLVSSSGGLFVERSAHVPQVEQQVAELASDEVVALAGELVPRGVQAQDVELGRMYVHVLLADDVRHAVEAARMHRSAARGRAEGDFGGP